MFRKRTVSLTILSIAAAIAVTACSGSATPDANADRIANASLKLPYENLSDWVSYSDQYSVFTILDEEELPADSHVQKVGEGYVGRSVTVRIDDTPWRSDGAPVIDGVFSMLANGWFVHGFELFPSHIAGAERLEVGNRYLAPLVLFEVDGRDKWGTNPPFVLRIDDDVVAVPNIDSRVAAPTVTQSLIGKSLNEVVELLSQVEPDTLSLKYSGLRPDVRWQAVVAEIQATQDVR